MHKNACPFQYFFVPNIVVQHVNCFVVCCIKTTCYERKGSSYLWAMWHTMLVSVYTQGILVTSPFKSKYFQIFFGNNYCRQTIEATTVKKVPKERKLIYVIYNFIVAFWCLLFSFGSHLNTTTNLNHGIF